MFTAVGFMPQILAISDKDARLAMQQRAIEQGWTAPGLDHKVAQNASSGSS